ncbi:nucleosidase [Ornithinimicrobium avium]|uniref:Nucleosidase n=1 Tax=Ornithinimicrobium avium TaxID=2283195 RepID=A0A345NP88_9MICO|nr:nucleosidase [Ornithinimicrobium avium]AXH96846.1 nucleosidase [Ornithinimicrobium avium]
MSRYLVVCAPRPEAAYAPPHLPVVLTGLGKTAAAVATTRALLGTDREGLTVLNVGTAGALRPDRDGLFLPSRVLNHDINAEVVRSLGADPREQLEIPGGDGTVLATGDLFVTDPGVRDRLAARADLVDMEGYAVAFACAALGVPVRLVKHVSDAADAGAMDWPDLVDASARALGTWLEEHAAD